MRDTSLYERIGQLNNEWIEEAAPSFHDEGALSAVLNDNTTDNKASKRKGPKWYSIVAGAACLILLVSGVSLLLGSLDKHKDDDIIPTTTKADYVDTRWDTQYVLDTDYMMPTEDTVEKLWHNRTLVEQYPRFQYDGEIYTATGSSVYIFEIAETIGTITLDGYDSYNNTSYTKDATIYSIEGANSDAMVAVRIGESYWYYVYYNMDYAPANLSDMMNVLDCNNAFYVSFANYYDEILQEHDMYVIFNSLDIEELFNSIIVTGHENVNRHTSSDADITRPLMDIICTSRYLENEYIIALYESGYININICGCDYLFNIGQEMVTEFISSVNLNGIGFIPNFIYESNSTKNYSELLPWPKKDVFVGPEVWEEEVVPPWDERDIYEQYNTFQWNEIYYKPSSVYTYQANTTEKLGEVIASGYDADNEATYELPATIYSITHYDADYALAIQYEGHDEMYVCYNTEYKVGSMLDIINNVFDFSEYDFTEVIYHCKNIDGNVYDVVLENISYSFYNEHLYVLFDNALVDVVEATDDSPYSPAMHIELEDFIQDRDGVYIDIYREGYITTNVLDNKDKLIYVGEDIVTEVISAIVNSHDGYIANYIYSSKLEKK